MLLSFMPINCSAAATDTTAPAPAAATIITTHDNII